jgi:hypothetical protein
MPQSLPAFQSVDRASEIHACFARLGLATQMHPAVRQSTVSNASGFATDPLRSLTSRVGGARLSSRKAEAAIFVLVCLGALCLFYFEVIFENRTFLPYGSPGEVMGGAPPWQFSGTIRANPYRLDAGGSAWQLEPWARTVAASYKSGSWPLWNPDQFFGTPLAADGQPGAFDLLRLPALITSHAWGWDLYYLSQSALCLVLTYVFGRSVGFRPVAASAAAVAYTFSGFMFIRGNMHYAEIFHLLPGVLLGTERVVRGAYRSGILIVAVSVAMTLLAGMPEATILAFLYSASYGAFRSIWEGGQRRSWRFAIEHNVILALAWLGGIGLAGPMLAPMVEYLGLSFNIHPPERGLGLIALPLRSLAYIGVPYINGLPTQPLTSVGLAPLDDYSGAAIVFLAILGTLSLKDLDGPRPVGVFALASSLIWGAKLFGLPGLDALGQLPVLVQTLIYIFGTPLLSFSLALLGAVAVHALAVGRVSFRTALIAEIFFAAYLTLAIRLNWQTLQAAGFRHAALTVGLAATAGLAGCLLAVIGRRQLERVAAAATVVLVTAELFVLAPHNVYSDRYDSLAEPPYVSWLQQQQLTSQPFRVFSNDGLLYPDYAQAFGLNDPRVIDGLWPTRTWDFVKGFVSPTISDRYVGGFGHPELPTELFANKWLDFSNVRYILRPADQSPQDATLAQVIVAANYPPKDDHHVAMFTIDGQRREVLVERTGTEIAWHLKPDSAQPGLSFSIGLDPSALSSSAAYSMSIQSGGQRTVLFQRSLDSSNESDRHWVAGTADLSPYIGQDVELILATQSPDGRVTSPGWGDLRLTPLPNQSQYRQVYAGEVSIWENTHAAPRAFLVNNVQRAPNPAQAATLMQSPDFDPLTMAVVEDTGANPQPSTAQLPVSAPPLGTASITQYGQQHIQIAADAGGPSLLVLTDTFYPGWTATLDGAQTPILATDLAFRGVSIPPGAHQVTFNYAPASFSIGLAIAAAALVLLGLELWRVRSERFVTIAAR